MKIKSLLLTILFLFSSCSSSEVEDALDIVDGIARKTIDVSRLGVNAFANDSRFGSIGAQYQEVRQLV